MSKEERKTLISKPNWTYQDIMTYFGFGKTKACDIKKKAIEDFGGEISYMKTMVKADSVLALLGTSREIEAKILSSIKDDVENDA